MKTYQRDYLQEIAFPLSGIGTGGLSISGIGALVDWELTGRANKKSVQALRRCPDRLDFAGGLCGGGILQSGRAEEPYLPPS